MVPATRYKIFLAALLAAVATVLGVLLLVGAFTSKKPSSSSSDLENNSELNTDLQTRNRGTERDNIDQWSSMDPLGRGLNQTGAAGAAGAAGTQCPRVRMQWQNLSPRERQLYINAIEVAMDRGYHMLFASIHSDTASNAAAHQHCGFFPWHRRYLLAYENMLRSLQPEFACLTIPYWNYFEETERFMAGQCRSQEQCSVFLQEMGGSAGPRQRINIMGEAIFEGNCCIRSPCNHFCENLYAARTGASCSNCIPRGDWANTPVNASFLQLSGLEANLADSRGTLEGFRQGVELGYHGVVHNQQNGLMIRNPYSAFDPIFFSHHSMVDLTEWLYYRCFFGDRPLTPQETRAIATCNPQSNGLQFPEIFMQLRDVNGRLVAADLHEDLAPFFSGLPRNYEHYIYLGGLGEYSYTYQLDNYFTSHFVRGLPRTCPNIM